MTVDIDKLREHDVAMTPGPWPPTVFCGHQFADAICAALEGESVHGPKVDMSDWFHHPFEPVAARSDVELSDALLTGDYLGSFWFRSKADAAAIAWFGTHRADILAELTALRAQVAALREGLEAMLTLNHGEQREGRHCLCVIHEDARIILRAALADTPGEPGRVTLRADDVREAIDDLGIALADTPRDERP
jgi:hypothetical protein